MGATAPFYIALLCVLNIRPNQYVGHLVPLAFLEPMIVRAILDGKQPSDLTAERLSKKARRSVRWSDQRKVLGFDRI